MTKEQLAKISSKLDFDTTNELFEQYQINTPRRQAMFLAQCAHESGGFKFKCENLNYSENALLSVFGKYFKNTQHSASECARKPEKIANIVYANRMGNGDHASGDGFKFRGRGYIQLTGRNNYTDFAKSIDKDIDEVVSYCETDAGALHSALYFWDKNNLNAIADTGDVEKVTRRVNGGTNGLEDRKKHYNEYLAILN